MIWSRHLLATQAAFSDKRFLFDDDATTPNRKPLPSSSREDMPRAHSPGERTQSKAMTRTESSCLSEDKMLSDGMTSTHTRMEEANAEASPSVVLSRALDMIDISSVGGCNEKLPSSGRPLSAPSMPTRRTSPINARNEVVSFSNKVVAHHHMSTSSTSKSKIQINNITGTHAASYQTKPKLVRLNSADSCSTTTSFSTTSSTVSSPSNSPIASPKRSIFQSYWEKNGTPTKTAAAATTISYPNIPHVASEDSTSDRIYPTQSFKKAENQQTAPSTPRSATVTLPQGYQLTNNTTTAGTSASPKRSIFGDRAMQTAKRSSLPDLPSIAATLITESDCTTCSTYTDYHRVHHVRKTSSTDHLVRVRKSCLRRVSLYSGSAELRKSASAISTSTTRPRASTLPAQPTVQFDPQVRVYEYHRTAEEPIDHARASSNDWSHLFA